VAQTFGHSFEVTQRPKFRDTPTLIDDTGRQPHVDRTKLNDAIERGLRIVTKAAANYPKHRDCFSCHHQTLPLLAMNAAIGGFEVEEATYNATADFTEKFFAARVDKLREGRGIGGQAATVGYGLWTLDIAQHEPDDTSAAMIEFLLKNQRDDGRWSPPSNRPPLEESSVSTTVLTAYYLPRLCIQDQHEKVQQSVARARKWLAGAKLESHEDYVFRLWGQALLEDAKDAASQKTLAALRDQLLAAQRDDGGWAQLPQMNSDAYATGQALYVLHEIGLPADSVFLRSGVEFLLKTQQEDGSWLVETRSRPIQVFFDNGDPHGKSQFISIAATSWAVAALAKVYGKKE
jgi:N-acyl-D-amino-acid deacylase